MRFLCFILLTLCFPISLWAKSHTVKKGETLWRIATNNNTTVDKLKAVNGITSNNIRQGQVLSLPSSSVAKSASISSAAVSSRSAPLRTTPKKPTHHKVRAGEYLNSIARRYGISVTSILKLNSISNPNNIQVGQVLALSTPSYQTQKRTPSETSISRSTASPPKSKPTYSSSSSRSKRYTIVIDPGHGGKDTGAVKYGLRESDLNLSVALKLASKLKAHGYRVVMTRTSDRYLSLASRAHIANKYSNSLFVSIHFNSATDRSAKGIETFYCSNRGKRLAQLVQYGIKRRIGSTRDRKVKYRRFSVLRNTNNPAILAECGFMSNYSENKRMRSTWWKEQCAEGIFEAIRKY